MKLNTRRTILAGFAFLSICAFWQMYDNLVPLILTNTFHMNETLSGVIMAADNVLALFMLPLFGSLSDKCGSKLGRRRPFILFGTLATAIAAWLTIKMPKWYLAAIPPILVNMIILCPMWAWAEVGGLNGAFWAACGFNAVTFVLGEAGACYVRGARLLKLLPRIPALRVSEQR